MTPEQRDRLIEILRSGQEIDPEWQRILFPSGKREYELVYGGKERVEEILADTMAVPLQPVRTFGRNGNGWHNKLIFGDNLQVMKSLLALKAEGKLVNADGSSGVRLIYIDPPFATKREFRGSQEQKAYLDKVAGAEFIEFIRKRLVFMRELLADNGAIYVHLDQRKSYPIKLILDEIFKEHRFVNEVVWRRLSAHNDADSYGKIHDTIFFYTKSDEYVWNEQLTDASPDYIEQFFDQVEIGPDGQERRYARGDLTGRGTRNGATGLPWRGIDPTEKGYHWAVPRKLPGMEALPASPQEAFDYLDSIGRIHWPKKQGGMPRLKRYAEDLNGVPVQDVWLDIKNMHNLAPEKTGYPTQKPEPLLERIIKVSSDEGDIVLDAFAGSGTTCAVAEKLGRRWVGIDCGKLAIYTIQKRMLNLKRDIGNKGPALRHKPFTLYNAGLYDFTKLRELPWEDWRFFALNLFQCKDEKHRVGGIELDGYLKNSDVLVFNHFASEGAKVTYETIDDIHQALGSKVGRRFFIIAPALCFAFQEDYVDRDRTRYYALRIPYSLINELHKRDFVAIRQPVGEGDINDTVESVGFDFIRTPEAQVTYQQVKPKDGLFKSLKIHVSSFKSEVIGKGGKASEGIEALSMLMVDPNYDGDVFGLEYCWFADKLKAEKNSVELPVDAVGERIMLVLVDIHGNEYREVKTRDELGLSQAATPVETPDRKTAPKRSRKKSK